MKRVQYKFQDDQAHTVEVVVHVNEHLGETQRRSLVTSLENDKAIVNAEFCPSRSHLMLVKYDRGRQSSQGVLGSVRAMNLNAQLIGPV